MSAPRISVALCTRNGGRFVAEQLRSILEQSHPVDQIVVSDDASTDDTVAVVRAVLDEHPASDRSDVVLTNERPLGVTSNFEQAIAACSGDLIILSDQDDVWHAERVASAVQTLGEPGASLVHSDARLVDADGRDLGVSLLRALEVSDADTQRILARDAVHVFIRRNLATGATIAFRRELFSLCRPFPPIWLHDEWLAMIAAATGGLRLDLRELIDYRQHGGNEVGARVPTFADKLGRLSEVRGEHNVRLAERAAELARRVPALPDVDPDVVRLVDDKAAFERFRAELSPHRLRRLAPVIRRARRGDYARLSSRGGLDVFRDLLQPATKG
ncbi:glycosyltransferase family 2 protein [Protaetiibacter intestinalis]|uniref:Glycosyltransferase family 2 protein n=1 Tax=Protaetiibacter intestinalis TaxID=2419774 RepID=A0A387BIJ3_9MICO|nr:glycosyltransferase family 2 protein [Protaetiibacter intestinalis]AYF98350.1 glycosyltransferase family 2 protein [Protaetiibacter intestinalis]